MNRTILDQLEIATMLGNAKGRGTLSNPIFEENITTAASTNSKQDHTTLAINIEYTKESKRLHDL